MAQNINTIFNQSEFINNINVKKAFEYYLNLPIDDKNLINDYKSEMDSDDWTDKPLEISYTVINWILQQKSRILLYLPELVESGAITKEQFLNQVYNAQKLMDILFKFPIINESDGINVYRGDTIDFGNYLLKNLKNNQISLYSFISTSLNLSVATNFSKGYLFCINIPSGYPLPFISDKLTMNYSFDINNQDTSESEVLLPLGCTFQLLDIKNQQQINGKIINIIYLKLISFGPHNTRNFWNNYIKIANNVYENKLNRKGGKKSRKYKKKNKKSRKNKLNIY